MSYKRIFAFFLILLPLTACDTLQEIVDEGLNSGMLSEEEVGRGLKQALEFGIAEGAQKLSAKNGYFNSPYRILLPEDVRKVTDKLQAVPGFSQLEGEVLKWINEGAEDAATRARPIFVQAIRSMTIRDAFDILMGDKDAATRYLQRATYDQLYAEFNPVITNSLDKFDGRKIWQDGVSKYNALPFVDDLNPDLDDYVTQEALKGLFAMVEKKEVDIRDNVQARTTDLLRRVFSRQDD